MYELRPSQARAVESTLDWINTGGKTLKKGLVVSPVGSGKSLIISNTAYRLSNPTIVLQPSSVLLEQNYAKLLSYGGEASIFSASAGIKEIGHLTYATLGSIVKKVGDFKKLGVDTVLIDEVDRGFKLTKASKKEKAGQFRKFIDELKPKRVIGYTATPLKLRTYGNMADSWTQLNMMVGNHGDYFKDIIDLTTIQEMVDKKYWADLSTEQYDFDSSKLIYNSSGNEFTEASISNAVKDQKINNIAYVRIKQLMAEGVRGVLVFMDSVSNCEIMAKHLGPKAVCVHGGLTKSVTKDYIERFKSGDIKVVLNHTKLGVGFDYPELSHTIIARPTNSLSLYYQWCLDTETEVLTEGGWRDYKSIDKDELIYGYDLNTGEIKKNSITNVIIRDQYPDEKMMNFSSGKLNFRVSEEHDMIYATNPDRYFKKKCKELLKLKGLYRVPVSGFEKTEDCGLKPCELEFLGWFLSDGHYNKNNKVVTISQSSKSLSLNYLINVLDKCKFKYHRNTIKRDNPKYADGYNFTIRFNYSKEGKRGWRDLIRFIDKDTNVNYNEFSRKDVEYLLKGLIAGDGDKYVGRDYTPKTTRVCMGINKEYSENIQSLLVRRGYSCNVSEQPSPSSDKTIYYLYIKDTTYATIAGYNVKNGAISGKKAYKRSRLTIEESSTNKLWCVTTEMGNIITRRKGKVVIMGNCGRVLRNPMYPKQKKATLIDLCGNVKRFGSMMDLNFDNVNGKWNLFSKDRLLSGVRLDIPELITTKDDLKKAMVEIEQDAEDMTIWFGKFKGTRVSEAPLFWCKWMLNGKFEGNTKKKRELLEQIKKRLILVE